MNEPEYFKLSQACAERTLREVRNDPAIALPRLYERITSHRPSPAELAILKTALDDLAQYYQNDPTLAQQIATDATGAAWAMLAHSLFNLESAKVRR